jgi:hypothetical protein
MEAVVFFEKLDFSYELTCLNIPEYSIALIPSHSYIFHAYDKMVIYKIWKLSLNFFLPNLTFEKIALLSNLDFLRQS